MNTNVNATSILAYGDSNTYGQKPNRNGRFDPSKRWTGILQSELGDEYYIIEEGLGGRTTDLDHPNPNKPSRNGLSYFKACLDSHSPIDNIIIMLGTNDFKTIYNRSAEEISNALKLYIDTVRNAYNKSSSHQPAIILVSPPYMDQNAPLFYESMPTPGIYDQTSIAKSYELAKYLEQLAKSSDTQFLDAALLSETGEDGCHMTEASHRKLGVALAGIIQQLYR